MHRVAILHHQIGGKAGGGGGVREVLQLAEGLSELGHQPVMICHDLVRDTDFGDDAARFELHAVRELKRERPPGRFGLARQYWRDMGRLARLVPGDVSVVDTHGWPALRAGRIAARRTGAPFVWTRNDETVFERAIVPELAIVSDRRLSRRALRAVVGLPDFVDARRAAAILVLNGPSAEMVERAYRRPARIVRHPPAADFFDPPEGREARRRLGVADGDFLVLGAAVLFPHRRFEDLLGAMALLPMDSNVRALIIGSDHADPGYADRLAELVRAYGVADRVTLTRSSVSDDELRAAYAAADVFVFPNQRQTWGLAPLEALAAGTPVILSTGAGVHEVLGGRPGVISVPPERPDAIAGALAEAGRRDLRGEALETREWIRRELNSRRYAERMVEVFDEVLHRR